AAEFDRVEYYMGQVAEIGRERSLEEPTLFGLTHLANTLVYLTRYDEALPVALQGLDAAEEAGNLKYQAELLTFSIPTIQMRNGEFEEAMGSIERGMEIAMRIGDRVSEAFAAIFQGKVATAQGFLGEAMALFRRADAALQATGIPYLLALGKCVSGTCLLAIGGPCTEQAIGLHRETLEIMDMPTGTTLGAWLWSEMGHCALAIGDRDLAKDLFDRALTEQTAPMHLMRPSALVGAIEIALAEGRFDDARGLHAELAEYVTTRQMLDQYASIPFMAGRIAAESGNHDEALDRFVETLEMFTQAGMRRMALDVHRAMAASYRAAGREEDALGAEAAAAALVGEIGASIADPDLQGAFLRDGGLAKQLA
ncbi:MAG TPA: hypothetical protein VLD62_01030, partial [Acidimicrobiia bacterium]|nr:hypothetical protein [Acidimicrobiia bacterium]